MDRILLHNMDQGRPKTGLLERQAEAARQMAMGIPQREVAARLGYHPMYMSHLKAKPGVRAKMDEISDGRDAHAKQIRDQVDVGAQNGLDLLTQILNPHHPDSERVDTKTKIDVAKDLLDRQGIVPRVTKSSRTNENVHLFLDADDLESLKADAAGVSIDVTPDDHGDITPEILQIPKRRSKGGLIPEDLLGQED